MKDLWNQVVVETKKIIKKLLIFSGFFEILFIISYKFTISNSYNLWLIVQLIIISYFIFFILLYLFTVSFMILLAYIKKKNIIAVGILILFLFFDSIYITKNFIRIMLGFYSQALGIDKATYLSSVIAILSLLVAISMPIYLTEKNRLHAEEIAKENQKYNKEIIANNRKYSEELMKTQLILNAMPVVKYFITGVIDSITNGIVRLPFIDIEKIDHYLKGLKFKIEIENIVNRVIPKIELKLLYNQRIIKEINNNISPLSKNDKKTWEINIYEVIKDMLEKNSNSNEIEMQVNLFDIFGTKYIQKLLLKVKINKEKRIYINILDINPLVKVN